MACNIALEATSMVTVEQDGRREIDIKRYAKVEKVIIVTKSLNEKRTSAVFTKAKHQKLECRLCFVAREIEIGLLCFLSSQRDITQCA